MLVKRRRAKLVKFQRLYELTAHAELSVPDNIVAWAFAGQLLVIAREIRRVRVAERLGDLAYAHQTARELGLCLRYLHTVDIFERRHTGVFAEEPRKAGAAQVTAFSELGRVKL